MAVRETALLNNFPNRYHIYEICDELSENNPHPFKNWH